MTLSYLPFTRAARLAGPGVLLAALLIALAACTRSDDASPQTGQQSSQYDPSAVQRQPGEARVALLLPLTGAQSGLGQALLNAAQMALFDVGGPNLELTVHDTGGRPPGAAQASVRERARRAPTCRSRRSPRCSYPPP